MPLEQRRRIDWGPVLAFLVFVGGLYGLYLYVTAPSAPDPANEPAGQPAEDPASSDAESPEPAVAGETDETAIVSRAKLRIRVEDATGAPAPGATVYLLQQAVYRSPTRWGPFDAAPEFAPETTDAEGAATFESARPLAGVHVLAVTGPLAGRSQGTYVADLEERAITIGLAECAGAEVVVTNAAGEALPDAGATLVVPLPRVSRLAPGGSHGLLVAPVSSESGRFRFPAVPRTTDADDTELLVHATAPGYLPALVSFAIDRTDAEPVRVVLMRAVTVSGRVLRKDDTPVSRARVVFDPDEEHALLGRSTTLADDTGAFALSGLPSTGGTLLVDAGGAVPVPFTFPAAAGETELSIGEIRVATGGPISGRVVDGAGKPVTNVQVFVTGAGGSRATRGVEVDGEGRFTLHELAAGTHRLFVREAGLPVGWEPLTGTAEDVAAGADDVEIVLRTERVLRIVFAFAKGHELPRKGPGIRVVVTPSEPEGALGDDRLYRDVSSVRMRCARPGTHRVTVEIEGYVTASTNVDVAEDAETICTVELKRTPIDAE